MGGGKGEGCGPRALGGGRGVQDDAEKQGRWGLNGTAGWPAITHTQRKYGYCVHPNVNVYLNLRNFVKFSRYVNTS